MDSLLPCTRIGQTMLSFEGSLPKVGRTTLAQEESLFNICVFSKVFTLHNPYSQVFKGSLVLQSAENAGTRASTKYKSYMQAFRRAHCITSKCAAETGEYCSIVYSTMHVRGRLLLHSYCPRVWLGDPAIAQECDWVSRLLPKSVIGWPGYCPRVWSGDPAIAQECDRVIRLLPNSVIRWHG